MTPKKILVVDDDLFNRRLEEALIRAEGHEVSSVDSGAAALAAIAAAPPDLILLDLMMPGMDGFEMIRRLKGRPETRDIPIILVTALDDEASRARVLSAGVAHMVNKPIDRWELKACMDQLLEPPR